MFNILFYYDNYCGETSRGGTEVATSRIARALQKYQRCRVYNAFLRNGPVKGETFYDGTIRLKKKGLEAALSDYIIRNEIGAVVNMGRFFRQRRLKKAIEKSGRDVKLIFMHHFSPGSELIKPTYASGWHLLKLNPSNPLYWLRATLYPLLRMPRMLKLRKTYRMVYEMSDKVVLLSDGYMQQYAEVGGLDSSEKFAAIPNIFEGGIPNDTQLHQKRVLILSRMDEIQKRISLALEIWKQIEENPSLADWHLDIVGSGHDMRGLQLLAGSLGLRRIFFHGWKDSRYFLERASILMMTSLYEGLPLTLIEAQSNGVVPIIYNSYASAKDVITDGVDGVMIDQFGDIDTFSSRLAALMENEEEMTRLAANAKKTSERFSEEAIASKWMEMLSGL